MIQLASLFDQYGSDKSNHHNYHLLYAGLLGPKRSSHLRILEIGLGTNNPDILREGQFGLPERRVQAMPTVLTQNPSFRVIIPISGR
jgi:hypothetical protein